jgi:hypothetical protein
MSFGLREHREFVLAVTKSHVGPLELRVERCRGRRL